MDAFKIITKYKSYLIPILVLFIIFVTSLLFLKPKIIGLIEIQKKNSVERKRLAQLSQKVAALEGLDLNELTTKSDSLLKILPAEKDVPNFLAALKMISQQTNVTLKSLKTDPGAISTVSAKTKTKELKGLPMISFSLIVQGENDKIKDFVQKVENVIPLMRIKIVGLSNREENFVEANLVLNAYFQPLPQNIGLLEQPISLITQEEESTYQTLSGFEPAATESSLPEVVSGRENPCSF